MRWNVRRLRLGLWVLTLLAAGLSGSKLVAIVQAKRTGLFDYRTRPFFASVIGEAESEGVDRETTVPRKVADFAKTWTSPINGYKPEPVREKPKEDEGPRDRIPDLKPIGDVLVLKNFTYSPDPKWCVAVFEYKDEEAAISQEEFVLRVGSWLKHPYDSEPFLAKVSAVTQEGVLIEWGGEDHLVTTLPHQDLLLEPGFGGDAEAMDASLSEQERAILQKHRGQEVTVKLSELGNDSFLVGRNERTEASYENWSSGVRMGTQRGPDGKEQVVVKSVRTSIGRTYGVQSGDVLVSINGTPVSSKTQAVNYVRQNPDLPKYVVVINRLGRDITKTIYVPQDE